LLLLLLLLFGSSSQNSILWVFWSFHCGVLSYCQHGFTQDNLCYLAPPAKNWRILLGQSFTARMRLLMATSAFGLGRRR